MGNRSSRAEAPTENGPVTQTGPSFNEFREVVLQGLAASPKRIASKWLYDRLGSALFERICASEDYYVTRTECAILRGSGLEIAMAVGPAADLVELGSGSSTKIRILLDALVRPRTYVPIDIARDHLLAAAAAVQRDYPGLRVAPLCADYGQPFTLPLEANAGNTVLFIPGSTLCNLFRDEMLVFMQRLGRMVGPGAALLVGVDLKKDERILLRAYNDRAGTMAAFNLNLLRRITEELGAAVSPDGFCHEARWNAAERRIEVFLFSRRAQCVRIAGEAFRFAEGEGIHMENSHKYSVAEFRRLAEQAGWRPESVWTDARELFSVHLLRRAGISVPPSAEEGSHAG